MKSGMAMVRVSGTTIRSLREEQDLTQLYLATAVGVTTETISRWERQDAPTIKEENSLKLAVALSVSLDAILAPVTAQPEPAPEIIPSAAPRNVIRKITFAVLLLLGSVVLFYLLVNKSGEIHFSAKRNMPGHSVAGRGFPVVIDVDFLSGKSSSLLLKEQLPKGCRVLNTMPQATVADAGFIKWIEKKGSGRNTFAYMASCRVQEDDLGTFSFHGTLLVRQSSRQEIAVDGRIRHQLLDFHWADTNTDNSIDDEELLAVYDDFGTVEGLLVDMEEVEAIWMGSGYRWNAKQAVFDIIP